tara:strand:- start:7053 stop:7211 length:159 start_codon:yes stop_codon:yes gene_type:complete
VQVIALHRPLVSGLGLPLRQWRIPVAIAMPWRFLAAHAVASKRATNDPPPAL